ncbi:MAG: hypothetical protein Q7J65_02305 [Candidatus Marinimicrobia bacterium]|nr:hypothetical protein [Candidatus Neomarinimicrobiota bacterium]
MFTIRDVAQALGISIASARVLCSRYSKSGQIIRIRNNFYILTERWNYLTQWEQFLIANRIQVPSYISLATAINYYELSEQIYRGNIESIAQKRSIEYPVRGLRFIYRLIKAEYYRGFILREGVFIAEPEKALADVIYYASIGRYAFDFSALNWRRLDRSHLLEWLSVYPPKTLSWWKNHGYF